MNEFWSAFLAGLAVLAVAGIAACLWKPARAHLQSWWAREIEKAERAGTDAEDKQMETLREQVAERARKLGKPMPLSASDNRVTYTDGNTATFIADFQQYRHAMASGRVDVMRTFNKKPPIPIARRDRAWLEQWLADNPEP